VIDPSTTYNSIQAPEGKKRNRKKNICMKASASLWTTCDNAHKNLNYPKLSKLPSSFTSLLAKPQKSLVSYSFKRLIHKLINPIFAFTIKRSVNPPPPPPPKKTQNDQETAPKKKTEEKIAQ
jgi:hypothetical protein